MENGEECLKQLQAIETGWASEGESALLRDLRTPSHGPSDGRADRNAYKRRLHALRRDYVNAHLRTLDLEDQLSQARLRILRLEARVQHLSGTLEQMRARLVWKVVERYRRWRRMVPVWLRHLRRLGRSKNKRTVSPADEVCGSCPLS
ncbi:MAG TPA: hypothetical protein VH575_31005 [Gemmataceae bacterium]